MGIISAMKSNKSIEDLIIGYNHFSKESALALAYMFKENKTLKSINLKGIMVSNDIEIIIDSLKDNNSIEDISLVGNSVPKDPIMKLLKLNQKIKTIQVDS